LPKGTPVAIRDKLYGELVAILKSPDIVKRLGDFAAQPGGQPPDQFATFIHAETDKWVDLAKRAGISAE
jgi:tripartite-type tricarboxylate transporter receptor subunit TctC